MGYVEIIKQIDNFTCIVLVIFALAAIIQILYYLFIYLRAVWHTEKPATSQTNETPPVSVIICARNEEENLLLNLPAVLEQDYPSFEVIVVNDCSEDNTEQILAEFKQKYPHLRSTIIRKDGSFINGKKFAATVGVKAAQHEWMLFTDADCRPDGTQWILSMSKYFVDHKAIVLGYGGYLPQKGYLNKWIRYNACFNALQYLGFALIGKAYMGAGRNLAYRQSLFFAHNGFAAHAHIPSGDDDMFVNRAATKQNVAVTCIKNAHTRAIPQKSFAEWIRQKRKNIAISRHYRNIQIFRLSLEPFTRVLMWASFVVLMFFCPFWEYILMALMLRMVIFLSVIRAASRKLNEPGIWQHAVFFDLVAPFVHFYLYLLNRLFSKHYQWK